MLNFRSLLLVLLAFGSLALSAQPAPSWAAKFWQGINVSDLSSGCVQRARKLVENANDAAISPEVPKDVLSTIQLLVIFPHPADGPDMVTHMGHSWYFHAVATYEYQGERYVMDGGIPDQAVPYCDWVLAITASALSKYLVFLAKPDFRGLFQNDKKRLCSGCDAGNQEIRPQHPVMLLPDEVVITQPEANVGQIILLDPQQNPQRAVVEQAEEFELPVIPDAPALRLALLIVGFRLLAHHALTSHRGGF